MARMLREERAAKREERAAAQSARAAHGPQKRPPSTAFEPGHQRGNPGGHPQCLPHLRYLAARGLHVEAQAIARTELTKRRTKPLSPRSIRELEAFLL